MTDNPGDNMEWRSVELLDGKATVRIDPRTPGGFVLDIMTAETQAAYLSALERLAARAVHHEDYASLRVKWYDTEAGWSYEDINRALNEVAAAVTARPTTPGSSSGGG